MFCYKGMRTLLVPSIDSDDSDFVPCCLVLRLVVFPAYAYSDSHTHDLFPRRWIPMGI